MSRTSLLLVLVLCAPNALAQGPFAGKWNTTYGPLTLTQNRNKVQGVYYNGTASLTGTVEKNRLSFTYKEMSLDGDGEFILSPDGKSFTGKWRTRGGQTWHAWNATLVGKIPVVVAQPGAFAGPWATTYGPLMLNRQGKKVNGVYYDGKATLQGTVEKNRLTFTFVETIGKGDGEFELSADGKSFTGRWRWGQENTWHAWNGTLPDRAPKP
jgi:hypothetical protein